MAIAEFTGRHAIDFGMMATGGVIAAIPPQAYRLDFPALPHQRAGIGRAKGMMRFWALIKSLFDRPGGEALHDVPLKNQCQDHWRKTSQHARGGNTQIL